MTDRSKPWEGDWDLAEEVGGEERLRTLVADFYDRVFDDALIGFMFEGHDREQLVEMQVEYARARLGVADVEYTGTPIRRAHDSLPIRAGQFDRRHDLLREVLDEYDVPGHVREAWLELEQRLRDLVLQTGEEVRDEMLPDD